MVEGAFGPVTHFPLRLSNDFPGHQRPFVSGRTSSARSHTSGALRLTDRRAEWQVSWGFWGRPVDWPDAETGENCSPEALFLRTS